MEGEGGRHTLGLLLILGIPCSFSQRAAATPSPEYKFSNMDQEKIMLVEKLCQLKKELVKQEEKAEFFEEHIAQLTEDIQGKSRYARTHRTITACSVA